MTATYYIRFMLIDGLPKVAVYADEKLVIAFDSLFYAEQWLREKGIASYVKAYSRMT